MNVQPVFAQDTTASAAGQATAYDSIWATTAPQAEPTPLERTMLAEDKLFVVLAVVLIIWFGILFLILNTDRKIRRLERSLNERISEKSTTL